ncbi:Hypothetical Protein RSKD131_1442 [Cereibacter sphaeroides KD131]|nr:Hypothetical Protein RSKD131_1442 [Cereibacter sphaeroides KD131]
MCANERTFPRQTPGRFGRRLKTRARRLMLRCRQAAEEPRSGV